MDYNEGGLNLTDICSKYGAQRIKWLPEAKNLPKDCIEHFLVNESLGFYKDVNITVEGFDCRNLTNVIYLSSYYCIYLYLFRLSQHEYVLFGNK